jgi:uncharacterized protein
MAGIQKYFIENENIGVYEQIFENVHIIDSHAHVGVDADGHTLSVPQLLKTMRVNDIDRSIIFPLNDPQAGAVFSGPNERILRSYKSHKEKFIPFFRLDPNHHWKEEFQKRLGQGFRGVKLHPLSQRFAITSPAAMKLYKQMEKDNLILIIHSGFGVENVAESILEVSTTFKNLRVIIAHGGFSELDEAVKRLPERPNVMFETSAMRFFDLVQLLKTVPHKQIVFGSDIPYYDQTLSLQMLVDCATISNHSPNQIRLMLGGNVERWLK